MEDVWPVVLTGVAGLLIGGVYSFAKSKRVLPAVVLGVLAAIALVGAVLWLLPQEGA